ncbi:hypothetical protein SNE40_001343 [Patella caerulea]|uniref:Uncharacterized protein n=1 Tax=Patella caerulea TaxID=87958 RepID=A0AAN8KIG6_PATCE
MMSTPRLSSGILRLKRSQMKGKSSGKKRSRTLYNKLNISLNSTKIVREALNLNNRALSTEQLKIQNEIQIMKPKCRLLMEENDNLDSEIEMLDRVASLTNSEEKCQAVIEVKEKVHVTGLTNLVLETMKDVNNALKSYKFLRFILSDAERVMDLPTDNVNTDDVNIEEDHLSYIDRLETVLNNMIKSADEEMIDDNNVCADTSVDEEMKASNRFNHNPCDVGLPQRIPCDSKDTPEESTENPRLQIHSDTFQNQNVVFSEMEEDYELSKTEDVSPVANTQETDVTVENKTTKQPFPQPGLRLKLQKPCEDDEIVVDETIYLNTDMEMTEVIECPINFGNKNNSNSTLKKPETKASTEDFLVSLRPKQKDKFGPENLFGFEFQTPDNKIKSSFKHPETKVISKQDKYDRLVVESEEDILKGDNSESKTLSRSKSRCRSKSKKTEDSRDVEPGLFSDEPCEIFNIPLQRESPLSKPRSKTGRSKHKKKTITMVGNDELEDVRLTNTKVNTKDCVIDINVGESKGDKNKSPVESISKGNSRSKTRHRSDDVKKADTTTVTTAVPSPTVGSSNVDISKDETLPIRGNTRSKKSHRSEDEKKPDTAMIVPNTPVNKLDTHLPDDKSFPKPILHEEKSRRKFYFSDGKSEDVLDEVKKHSTKSKSKKSSNLQHELHKLVSDSSSNEESPIISKRTPKRYSNEDIKESANEIIPTRKISTTEDDEIMCIPDSCKKSKKSFDSPSRNEDVDQDDSDNKFKRSRRTKEPISYKERPINIKMRKEITDGKIVESCRLSEKGKVYYTRFFYFKILFGLCLVILEIFHNQV